MRPYLHAKSSASQRSDDWQKDLAIHEFIDSSKFAVADLRHRMVLHSVDLGGLLASLAFPERHDVVDVVSRHVTEDLGRPVALADWLKACNLNRLPRPHPSARQLDIEALILDEADRQSLADTDGPKVVWHLLNMPVSFVGDSGADPEHARAIFCNSFGLAIVRRVLGPPRQVPGKRGREVIFDPAWCAEAMIHRIYHSIPSLQNVVQSLRGVGVEYASTKGTEND